MPAPLSGILLNMRERMHKSNWATSLKRRSRANEAITPRSSRRVSKVSESSSSGMGLTGFFRFAFAKGDEEDLRVPGFVIRDEAAAVRWNGIACRRVCNGAGKNPRVTRLTFYSRSRWTRDCDSVIKGSSAWYNAGLKEHARLVVSKAQVVLGGGGRVR